MLARTWPDIPAPIAVARVDQVPTGVPRWSGPATSACQFWTEARTHVFAAGPDHGLCPIGRVTQGFATELPASDELLELMMRTEYLHPEEIAALPRLPSGHGAIVYGPLDAFPVAAELVVLVVAPQQAMVLSEALGLARLDSEGLRVIGRPTCAALSAAIADSAVRGSLACVGARLFAGLRPGEMVLAIPARFLPGLAARVAAAVSANHAVGAYDRALREGMATSTS